MRPPTTLVWLRPDGTRMTVTLTDRRVDLTLVGTVARLALAARRRGGRLVLVRSGPGLAGLLDLAGLGDVVASEAVRQPELREDRRPDEVVQALDPSG